MASLTITPASVQQSYGLRHEAHSGADSSMTDTARRVSPLVLGLIAGLIASVILGPLSGLLIGAGVALLSSLVVSSCWSANLDQHQVECQPAPWYQRTVHWIPSFFYTPAQPVVVGTPVQPVVLGGGFRHHAHSGNAPHVGVGRGHFHPAPAPHPAPPPFSAPPVHSHGPPPAAAPHVGVGRGHFHPVPGSHPAPPPVHSQGPSPAAAPHVGVGRGHFHSAPVMPPSSAGPVHPQGQLPNVGVGRGHYR